MEHVTIVLCLVESGAVMAIECVWVTYGLFWTWYGMTVIIRLANLKAFQEALSKRCA